MKQTNVLKFQTLYSTLFVSPAYHGRHIGIMLSVHFCSITFEGRHWFHSVFAELYITIKYRSSLILVIICQILAELWPFFDLAFIVRFHSVTFEGMHWFHSDIAELYSTVKCRSSSILVIIHQILAEVWPFFNFVFVSVLILVSDQELLQGYIDFIERLQKDISL